MAAYLCAKFKASSITLTGFRQGVILLRPPHLKTNPKKPTQIRVKDLFSDLLNETKGFKYQITVKVLFKKYKHNEEICSSLFQFIHKNSDKSQIPIRKFFSRHFIHDSCLD